MDDIAGNSGENSDIKQREIVNNVDSIEMENGVRLEYNLNVSNICEHRDHKFNNNDNGCIKAFTCNNHHVNCYNHEESKDKSTDTLELQTSSEETDVHTNTAIKISDAEKDATL